MADYIYLIQNRLTPAQWRALETVREAARAHGMPVFLVGGAVRDLTSGTPVRDLDFAIQGEAEALVPDLEGAGAAVTGRNQVLSSVYLSFRGGVRGELSPTLTVSYPKPGQPEVHTAPILDDLRRRDFTANAMAVSLNEGSYGLLLDPLNGTADIENRELRLVSAYGFIEQPALLLRAARLRERLGWNLESRTETRYGNSKEENHIEALPATDRAYELEELFHEEDPLSAFENLQAEGFGDVLFSALHVQDADHAAMDHVRDLMGQLEGQGIHPDPSAIFFPLITAKLDDNQRAELKKLFARPGFAEQIDTIETRARELGAQLSSKAAAQPSDSWRLLKSADPELVLWLAVHVRTGAVQSKIKAFLKDWPQMRQKIPYALMQEMRITPELPGYEALLDDLFFALIDGKLDTPEATRAFLEPFSPPAPPQVNVRRRPAKATRGRAKKMLEVAAAEPDEDSHPENEDTGREDDEDTPSALHGDTDQDASDMTDEDADSERDTPAQPVPARPKPGAEKKSAKAVKAPAKVKPETGTEAAAKAPSVTVAAPSKTAPVKAEAADSRRPQKNAQPLTAPVKSDAKKAAPEKSAAKATPSKATVKAPAKLPVKASSAKVPSRAPVKGAIAAKSSAKAPAKTAPVKAVSKGIAAKTPAKKQAQKAAATAPARKGAAPEKAAKKVAVQGKKGR